MTDTSPEALDRLIQDCRLAADTLADTGRFPTGQGILRQAADTIAALRAAPVAKLIAAADNLRAAVQVMRHHPVGVLAEVHVAVEHYDAIRALPLDAPAPVDPVAEARQEKDGLSEMERQLRRALAQEARHEG
jgi:hypothetical protein